MKYIYLSLFFHGKAAQANKIVQCAVESGICSHLIVD